MSGAFANHRSAWPGYASCSASHHQAKTEEEDTDRKGVLDPMIMSVEKIYLPPPARGVRARRVCV